MKIHDYCMARGSTHRGIINSSQDRVPSMQCSHQDFAIRGYIMDFLLINHSLGPNMKK